MFKNCISAIFLFFVFTGFSQQQKIDSLRQTLKSKQSDTARVNTLNSLAYLYYGSKPDSTLLLSQEAIQIAKKNDFIRGEARGLSNSGIAFHILGNYPKALELFLTSLKKYESINNLEGIANSSNNIGSVYLENGDYSESLDYFFKTLEIDKRKGNRKGLGMTLGNIAGVYLEKKELDSARTYALEAYDISMGGEDQYTERINSLRLGEIYFKIDQLGMAKEFYRNTLVEKKKDLITADGALGLAKIFKEQNQNDSTLYYAEYSYSLGKDIGSPMAVLAAATLLSTYYENKNDYQNSHNYLKTSLAAKDSLYNQEKRNKLQALSLEETARQQEIEIALLEAEKMNRLNLNYLGITAAIVVFILIFFILSRSIIIGEKWLSFLGIFILLLVFEFINLYFAPIISEATNYSPIWTLLIMVGIAALLVPLHHKIEKYVTKKMVKKNKQIKIAAARRTLERLEAEE